MDNKAENIEELKLLIKNLEEENKLIRKNFEGFKSLSFDHCKDIEALLKEIKDSLIAAGNQLCDKQNCLITSGSDVVEAQSFVIDQYNRLMKILSVITEIENFNLAELIYLLEDEEDEEKEKDA